MNILNTSKPFIMGGLMGLMMMWMLHGALRDGDGLGAGVLIAFFVAHFVLAAVAIGAVVFAARLSPRIRDVLARLHRPSGPHVAAMLGSAALVAVALHVGVHGMGNV